MGDQGNRGSPPTATVPPSASPGRWRRVIVMRLLGRGAHAGPRVGCNVLEYASVLGAEPWSSCPASVHPALAYVARVANDTMTDDRRRLLVPIAPWLLGTGTAGSQAWPAITTVCVRAAGAQVGEPDETRVAPDLDRAPWAGWLQRRRTRRAIRSALLAVAAAADREVADASLCQLLVDCVNECRLLAGEPPVHPLLPLADCPRFLAVEPRLLWSPGCDWMELGYRQAESRAAGLGEEDDSPRANVLAGSRLALGRDPHRRTGPRCGGVPGGYGVVRVWWQHAVGPTI